MLIHSAAFFFFFFFFNDTATTEIYTLSLHDALPICYARRPHLPQVNKSKGASFPGFQRGQGMLGDEWRWKIYTYMLSAGSPPPHESVLRVQKLPGFSFRFAEPWIDVIADNDGVTVKTTKGTERFDVVLMGTGFDVDLSRRPELASFAANIKTWG